MKGKEYHLFSPGDLISHKNVININRKKKKKNKSTERYTLRHYRFRE